MCADLLNLKKDIKALEKGGADYLHFDIMDGHFVPNFTLGFDLLKAVKKASKLKTDVHLMIENPELYVDSFIEAGADLVVVHSETTDYLPRLLNQIKERSAAAGVAFNPATALKPLKYLPQNCLDLVLIMTVNPGFAGQKFIPETIQKVAEVRQILQKSKINADIEVDGGISKETMIPLAKAGANVFVGGTSFIFKRGENIEENTRKMKKWAEELMRRFK